MAVYEDLERLYAWIDEIPLSRCKRNLPRDFSDGVLMAELCKNEFPKLVDLHNYPAANSLTAKIINWETLNRKVFSKLEIRVTTELIHKIAAGVSGAVESVLLAIKQKADERHKQPALSQALPGSRGGIGDYTNSDSFPDGLGILSEIKKLKKEVHMKNSTIEVLNQKVMHLENLMQMKDRRLKELTMCVDRLQTKEKISQDSFCTSFS